MDTKEKLLDAIEHSIKWHGWDEKKNAWHGTFEGQTFFLKSQEPREFDPYKSIVLLTEICRTHADITQITINYEIIELAEFSTEYRDYSHFYDRASKLMTRISTDYHNPFYEEAKRWKDRLIMSVDSQSAL